MTKIKPPSESDNRKRRIAPPLGTYQQRLEEAFPVLCQGHALAYSQGRLRLQDAVDTLQDWAFSRGLVELIGQDEVQRIMAEAFLPHRKDLA